MNKLYFNTRDELTCIDINLVAAVQADGNYSKVIYVTQKEIILTHGISKVEEALKLCNDSHNTFVRLGRSVVINHAFLQKIDLQKSVLVLGDGQKNEIKLSLPKQVLKTYREAVIKKIEIQGSKRYGRDN
ncbi:MAG: LytTR family transcriptional regulator DNA-binding domain-containing protein [Prevotellaceae bacterium]|nr:LytTR family transcriptional regulator DNA-binding domain-containing protein [Candidatus Minthosoma caballi]